LIILKQQLSQHQQQHQQLRQQQQKQQVRLQKQQEQEQVLQQEQVQVQELLLFYHKQPKQQQQSQRSGREIYSFEIPSKKKLTISGNCFAVTHKDQVNKCLRCSLSPLL